MAGYTNILNPHRPLNIFVIPLAWLQLTYQKGRLAIAIAGIMFAMILIGMQLGFQGFLLMFRK